MTFSPTEGILIEYKGDVGHVVFVCDESLTFCKKRKSDNMTGDICIVVYSYEWDKIKLLQGHHRQ